jgi:hypothetical protein
MTLILTSQSQACRAGCLNRFERLMAFAMLLLLLLAGILGGFVRECFGQDGHHAIEWVHGSNISDLNQNTRSVPGIAASNEKARSENSCTDRLLFAELLCPSAPIANPIRIRQAVFPTPAINSILREKLARAAFLAVRPYCRSKCAVVAIRELQTVVLLN